MIKKIIFPLLAIILLSSCAHKFGILKRKYNKGFYIANSKSTSIKKHENNTFTDLKPKPISPKTSKDELVLAETIKPVVKETQVYSSLQISKSKNQSVKNQNNKILASAKNSHIQPQITFKKIETDKLIKKTGSSKGRDSDVTLIILVILSIFIPPLAVYLKKNSINVWFWLTLIFCLLTFSVFFFIFGGFLWLVAVIIALLYVFDAIS
jgi:uncharacterized membrane protein YqaE (UPF0057 family)